MPSGPINVHKILYGQWNYKGNISNVAIITTLADGLTPLGNRTAAGTVLAMLGTEYLLQIGT